MAFLSLASVSQVFPLSYLDYNEHVEGGQGYYKDVFGSFVLDRTLSPTKNDHVILPTQKLIPSLLASPAIHTVTHLPYGVYHHVKRGDLTASSNINRCATDIPPIVGQMVNWLEEEEY
jgi:hypothetical protein